MGSARLRNRQEQKCLDQKLQEMTSHFRCKSTRMMTEIGDLQDKAKDMLPIGGKMIVCPKGLSEKEKKRYRRLRRRSSTPSMTLTEFDEKLTDFRHEIKTYRRGSNSTHPDDVFLFDANIVDVENHEFCAPLNKHKHAMKEAFRRATTKDVGANPGGQQAHGTHPGTQTRKTVTMMSSDMNCRNHLNIVALDGD
nr:hypothetical protein BaRGS_030715 [Batillaria attramentaria]